MDFKFRAHLIAFCLIIVLFLVKTAQSQNLQGGLIVENISFSQDVIYFGAMNKLFVKSEALRECNLTLKSDACRIIKKSNVEFEVIPDKDCSRYTFYVYLDDSIHDSIDWQRRYLSVDQIVVEGLDWGKEPRSIVPKFECLKATSSYNENYSFEIESFKVMFVDRNEVKCHTHVKGSSIPEKVKVEFNGLHSGSIIIIYNIKYVNEDRIGKKIRCQQWILP